MNRKRILWFFCITFFIYSISAQTGTSTSSLANLRDRSDFTELLKKAYTQASSIEEATKILSENVKYVKEKEKKRLLCIELARLYELSGQFGNAAVFYEEAAWSVPDIRDIDSLLSSCAAWIASGNMTQAESILKALLLSSENPESRTNALVLSGWINLVNGKNDEVIKNVKEILTLDMSPKTKLDTLMLAWAVTKNSGKEYWASMIKSEFPDSPQALIISGSPPPVMPHWLLTGLFPFNQLSSVPEAESKPEKNIKDIQPSVQVINGNDKNAKKNPVWLQAGAFADKTNAVNLEKMIAEAGFDVSVINKTNSSVWLVVVSPGKEPLSTLDKLKNAGFDAFFLY